MGRYVAKLADDAYCEWSTVVDAPVSWIVPRTVAVNAWTEERVERADRNGTSLLGASPETAEEIVSGNRAGLQERELTLEQILEEYDVSNSS
jgi:predicted metal-dependent phosphoesterase TrpH